MIFNVLSCGHAIAGASRRYGTGKTSLALRFIKGQFYDQQVTSHLLFVCFTIKYMVLEHLQEPTIGAAFFTQTLSLSEATVKFDKWDTAGRERYHSLAPMYYRGAAAAVVVYDISNMVVTDYLFCL